jgi:ketosteroid isomerase-like protein
VESTNRALVEELYRRLNDQDLGVLELFHPQVEWRWPATTPGQSVYRGHQDLRSGLGVWTESWGDLRMEAEELIEDGDDMFALTRYRARGAGSGIEVETAVGHLFRIRDGLVTRWWMFGDAHKARRRFVAGDRPA